MDTSLYLFPQPPMQDLADLSPVIAALTRQGFIGEKHSAGRYLTGVRFFEHISFVGCSPHLPLQPPHRDSLDFCHVSVYGDLQPPPLLVAPHRARPRCPDCRTAVVGWKDLLPEWKTDASRRHHCMHCGKDYAVGALDWRQYGLGARTLVQIHHVYPGEAVPGDALLTALAQAVGCRWGYAWAQRYD